MGRPLRLRLTGLPYVLHNHCLAQRQAFANEDSTRAWLNLARQYAQLYAMQLHGYTLAPTSMYLLATPLDAHSIPQFMRALSKASTHTVNQQLGQHGSIWQARYRASLVQPGDWALEALHFVESQGSMGSSLPHHTGAARSAGLTPLATWWQLGNTPFAREAAWQARHAQGLSPARHALIAARLALQQPLADIDFLAQLAQRTGQSVLPKARGRPARKPPP